MITIREKTVWSLALLGVAFAFTSIFLRARQVALGYRLAEARARCVTLEREVAFLRFACAHRAAPAEVLARGHRIGLDLRPPPSPVRPTGSGGGQP